VPAVRPPVVVAAVDAIFAALVTLLSVCICLYLFVQGEVVVGGGCVHASLQGVTFPCGFCMFCVRVCVFVCMCVRVCVELVHIKVPLNRRCSDNHDMLRTSLRGDGLYLGSHREQLQTRQRTHTHTRLQMHTKAHPAVWFVAQCFHENTHCACL
jgi:hypothetical protein